MGVKNFEIPRCQALQQGLASYYRVAVSGLGKKPVLTIIDYRLASTRKRLWVFDMAHDRLVMRTLVAHGRESGKLYAKRFSNRSHSKQSSLGAFVTEGTYVGHAGYRFDCADWIRATIVQNNAV